MCFVHIIVKYSFLVSLQKLIEKCDNFDKAALSWLTDYSTTGRRVKIISHDSRLNYGEYDGHLYIVIHVHTLVCILTKD